ncbi:organic anion transporter polypeptide (OATP) family domain-containing protein [Phthorimaea operculella]|nr:organic anion transporter polypeptide (OATP) family domain-containing protein [Phthorimaea operculella]
MVVNGFVNVVITTIEKRFGLRSMQTGVIAGGHVTNAKITVTTAAIAITLSGSSKLISASLFTFLFEHRFHFAFAAESGA